MSHHRGLLRNRNYALYNTSNAFSQFGYSLYSITIPAYSFVYSGSIVFTGLTLFVEFGIYALTFLVGPVVDRIVDKRRVFLASYGALAVLALTLGIMIESGSIDEISFLAIVGAIAVAWDFGWTADWTVLPSIVDNDQLPKAQGYSSAIIRGHTVAGLGVGGALYIVLGAYSSILAYSFCLLITALLWFFIPVIVPNEGRTHSEGLLAGWRYVFSQKELLQLSIVVGIFAYFSTLPMLGITRLFASSSALWYSVMFTLYYAGSMLSGILFGRYYPRRRLGQALALTYIIAGSLLVSSVALTASLAADAILWLSLGFAFTAWITLYSVYLQVTTVKEMLGRAASNLYTFRGVTSALGTISLPLLIQSSGIVIASVVSGLCMVLFAILVYFGLPTIRKAVLKGSTS